MAGQTIGHHTQNVYMVTPKKEAVVLQNPLLIKEKFETMMSSYPPTKKNISLLRVFTVLKRFLRDVTQSAKMLQQEAKVVCSLRSTYTILVFERVRRTVQVH